MKTQFKIEEQKHKADLCIIGGGLSGTIAALTAARKGAKVVLIQDRPVLGGNCSSEIRMWVRGAKGKYDRETGVLAEFEEEHIYRNPTLAPTLWDSVLFGKVKAEKNITLLLNCSCMEAEATDTRITAIRAWQLTTYTRHTVEASYFADCSGDGILAFLTPAKARHGREDKAETGETIAKERSDACTMGMSLLVQARETDAPVPFTPPEWAYVYETDADFAVLPGADVKYSTFRDHKIGTSGCNLWWIELGGDRDSLHDAEEMRDELLKIAFGIWDHIKNRGDHGFANWELEWVGFLPGKRESTRFEGAHMLTQQEIEAGGCFADVIAYGGWPMDDHNPKGFYANTATDTPSILHPAPSPYGIPYGVLYSKNIENLFFAGRNISATHAAMSSTRVMGTCSLLGQALGNAAAICVREGILPRDVATSFIDELQQAQLDDGIFLPGVPRRIPALTKKAKTNLTAEQAALLFNGIERPRSDEEQNMLVLPMGAKVEFTLERPEEIQALRLLFDRDYSRQSITPNRKMQIFTQKLNVGRDFVPAKVPATLVKAFRVWLDGRLFYETDNNYYSLIKLPIHTAARTATVEFLETWGAEDVHLFACDIR
ncbi:MAG: FAD-dependent oxidoreductase [Ruminococcaceae bacterium]|nr:FAD-dependent oxidoreductase [Oscillospiraceae bacterium]